MLLKGRYNVVRKLKSGGFGQTYLAEDTHMPSKRLCLVKHLIYKNGDPKSEALVRERFEREAAVLEQLSESTDQVPKLYAFFPEESELYLVEEWIDGESLQDRWQAKSQLGEEEAIKIMFGVLDGLEKLHAHRLIHRDIKPDNIILRKRDGRPVLIDFGAVKESADTIIDPQGRAATRFRIGTPGFVPPEQLDLRPVFASDLYSLGVTVVCLLTGKWPHQIYNPANGELEWRNHAPNVSSELGAVLDKATRVNFVNRYLRASEMRDALVAVLESKRRKIIPPALPYPPTIIRPQPIPPAPAPSPDPVNSFKPTLIEVQPGAVELFVKKIPSFFKTAFNHPWRISFGIFGFFYMGFLFLAFNINISKEFNISELSIAFIAASAYGGPVIPFIAGFSPKRSAYVIGALSGMLFYQGCLGINYLERLINHGGYNNFRSSLDFRFQSASDLEPVNLSLAQVIENSWSRSGSFTGLPKAGELIGCILLGVIVVVVIRLMIRVGRTLRQNMQAGI